MMREVEVEFESALWQKPNPAPGDTKSRDAMTPGSRHDSKRGQLRRSI